MRISFTGLDRKTCKAEIETLLEDDRVELGVLYSRTPRGRNRYPEHDQIAQLLDWCRGRGALHICGAGLHDLLDGYMEYLTRSAVRIQVNGPISLDEAGKILRTHPAQMIITQNSIRNLPLLNLEGDNHALLVDGSTGYGRIPETWERPDTVKQVGFAGGLGPDNIKAELERIRRVATEPYWIDMESGLRKEDWFDFQKALKILININ